MIAGKVFQNLSRKTGIKAEALEKDYVMNLILDAIAHCPKTRDSFFFKGGCCVHKCFSAHMFTPKSKPPHFQKYEIIWLGGTVLRSISFHSPFMKITK